MAEILGYLRQLAGVVCVDQNCIVRHKEDGLSVVAVRRDVYLWGERD